MSLGTLSSQITGGGGHSKTVRKTKTDSEKVNALSVYASSYNLSIIEYERLLSGKIGLSLGIVPVGGYLAGKYHLKDEFINNSAAMFKIGYSYKPLSDFNSFQIGIGYIYRAPKLLAAGVDFGLHTYSYLGTDADYFTKATFTGLYANFTVGLYFPW